MSKIQRFKAKTILEGFAADGTPITHENAVLVVCDGRVRGIEPSHAAMDDNGAEVRDLGANAVIVPGMINAHHHVGLTPLRMGVADHPLELWFASRLALRDVDLYTDTLFSAFEMIRSGVTAVQHLHSRVAGATEDIVAAGQEVIRAYRDIGMRASYSMALRDQNRLVYGDDRVFAESVPEPLRQQLHRYFERFTLPLADQLEAFHALAGLTEGDPRVRIQLAPANLHWLSDAALLTIAELSASRDVPLHMHLLETPYQEVYAQRRTGRSAVHHLADLGILSPRLTLGHGVWMGADDIERCAHSGVHICHNCSSNLRLKSGRAPVNEFRCMGVPVAIGIDEAGINDDRDMFQEMRLVLNLHRDPGHDSPTLSGADVLRMATEFGAATTPYGSSIGSLRPDSHADFFVLDWEALCHPWQSTSIPLEELIVRRAREWHVRLVAVAGQPVYEDGRFLTIDGSAILDTIASQMHAPLTPAEVERIELAASAMPHVKAFYASYEPVLDYVRARAKEPSV